jgi:hypothetical protein
VIWVSAFKRLLAEVRRCTSILAEIAKPAISITRLFLKRRTQRDSNPRPTAPQAAILSKLNYGPSISFSLSNNYVADYDHDSRKSNVSFFYIPQLKPRCGYSETFRNRDTYSQASQLL